MLRDYAETGKISAGQSMERLLETAVMRQYAPQEAQLLKALSVLDSFTPQQAVYLTQDTNAENTINICCK